MVFIRGSESISFTVQSNEKICHIKDKISDNYGIEPARQLLSFHGKPLNNEATLADYDINDQSFVDLSVKLLGGKVHGSLARAGKVKGQTPKVEKQEKKKSKTGRAKRRIQYNRRFVNVVADKGKRRGPNANS